MWKKILSLCFLLVAIVATPVVLADDPCLAFTGQSKVDCYSQKVADAQGQAKTLSSQIDYINSQISLTKSKIDLTQQKLDRLTDDISSVSGKIDRISESLDQVSKVLANRIVETYVAGRTEPVFYLLLSADFSDFFQRLDYLRIVQKHDKTLLTQMATTKKNYNDQRDLLTEKKKQVEALSLQLKNYKAQLDRQNKDKQGLLAVTQNDEATYQGLLSAARAQLAAFQGFVVGQGGASLLSGQTKCDDWGCYYNQRDSNWGGSALNHTGYTLADSGCLVTSMAMVATHFGKRDVTPQTINGNPDNFAIYYPAYLNKAISAGGASFTRIGISSSQIDGELSAGRPVVVGIGYGPSHFVVLVSGSGGNYTMNDPYVENGSKISFNSHYSMGSVTEIDRIAQ